MGEEETAAWGDRTDEGGLLAACRVLFGPEVSITPQFLRYLQPEGARNAYRQRVREHHPDRHPQAGYLQVRQLEAAFIQTADAYRQLTAFLTQRPVIPPVSEGRPQAAGCNPVDPGHRPAESGTEQRRGELFHEGPVPAIPLKIGRYLYFRGVVSLQAVMRALCWQRGERPSLGTLARSRGWLDDGAVHRILQTAEVAGRFGERAVSLGLLTPQQCRELLAHQRAVQPLLGGYFVAHDGLTRHGLTLLERERCCHNQGLQGADRFPLD